MITIQEAHKYLKLTKAKLATPVTCLNDSDHPELVSWLDENEDVIFICLACEYKIRPGYKMVRYIQFVNSKFTS